ncbi:MAG: GTPase ObgE [Prevotella sp.]|nr:GTPase ObgE [Prevotella sp.]
MAESNFVDYVKIYCRSGKGGRGSMHMRHVKYNPLGGPDGGDGGNGGSVILRGNHNYWTLLHLKYERHVFAEHGGNGGRDKCHGTNGKHAYIDVPPGTVVYDAETGRYVCDVAEDGQQVVLLKGGRGGLGNFQFRTATRQAPRFAQPGEPMQEMTVILELKLLADVGLVGLPNAGKSTLLSALSSARPKIAGYPFTTLEPSLGIVGYRDRQSFVMADIPGIIEGAAEGKGLGLRFLRHIERNSLLLFMVPADTDNIVGEYQLLLNELGKFNPQLLDKQRVLAVTKSDMLDDELVAMLRQDLTAGLRQAGLERTPLCFISAVAGQGLQELKDLLWQQLNSEANKLDAITAKADIDQLVHRDKDMQRFRQEIADEGEDLDIEYVDADDIEDIDDFEYLEDIDETDTLADGDARDTGGQRD